ncbi:phosphate butyryltransferase, partial [Staphylococcus arlettae]
MQYQHLVQNTSSLEGNVAIIFPNNEKIMSVAIEALKTTNVNIYLYDTTDLTELLRSFDIDTQYLLRISTQI